MSVPFAVESWSPEFGAAVDGEPLEPPRDDVDPTVEVPVAAWRSLRPTVAPARSVRFVDGVRRVDARLWFTTAEGGARPALAASYAAGTVSCDGEARVEHCRTRRVVVSAIPGGGAVATRCGDYLPVLADSDAPEDLVAAVQSQMRALERELAAAGEADLTVVDGLLSRPAVPGAVGYVKTHHRAYLQPAQAVVVGRLEAGERTPLFATSGSQGRYSWYARLPGGAGHPLAGVVRGEVPDDLSVGAAVRLADLATVTWQRFASAAHKDPRAPQNLHPIAGLERALRHRLGDAGYLLRALRAAAAAA